MKAVTGENLTALLEARLRRVVSEIREALHADTSKPPASLPRWREAPLCSVAVSYLTVQQHPGSGKIPLETDAAREPQEDANSDKLGTLGDRIDELESAIASMAEAAAETLFYVAEKLVQPEKGEKTTKKALMAAVLASRDGTSVTNYWPWPTDGRSVLLWRLLQLCDYGADDQSLANELRGLSYWEGLSWAATDTAPLKVFEWAEPLIGDAIAIAAKEGGYIATTFKLEHNGHQEWHSTYGLAVLYRALEHVREGQRLPLVRIDAGEAHHTMLATLRDSPKDLERRDQTITLLAPGQKAVQLSLEFQGETLSEATIITLRKLTSAFGLRNWSGVQQLLTRDGASGIVRWDLASHMAALGYSPAEARRPAVQTRVVRQVEMLTQIELQAKNKRGEWERRPLLMIPSKRGRTVKGKSRLEGMDLQINPLLYSGVRSDPDGPLGSNFGWTPPQLPQVDHQRFPYAHALGMLLPIRFRLRFAEGADHLTLRGDSILRLAAIPFNQRKPGTAWDRLDKTLVKLRQIGLIERAEWNPGEERTHKGRLQIYPGSVIADRMLRGVRPHELRAGERILTGGELKTWRKQRGWNQADAAKHLGVVAKTIGRAEKKPDQRLTTALADKIGARR